MEKIIFSNREKELLEKTIDQTKMAFDFFERKRLGTNDPLAYIEEMMQCEAIIKAIRFALGGS